MKNELDSKIFVAGYTGLVGSAILAKLKNRGYHNFLLKDINQLDLRRQNETEEFFKNEKPDYVFLAAAKVGGIAANDAYKAEFIYDNMAIALNTINSAYKSGVKKLLNLGSSCIYPKHCPQPMKEEYLLSDKLEPTNEPYAIAKISAIKLCRYFNEQYGTNFISVMPTNLYGLNDNYNLETSHVLPALIRKMLLAKALREKDLEFLQKDLGGHPLGFGYDNLENSGIDEIAAILEKIGITKDHVEIWGSGNVKREFLHADDMADACIYLMENWGHSKIGEFVNIGTGKDLSIKELAHLIKDIVGFHGELQFNSSKPEGTPRKLLDVTRINELGWAPQITLEKGIRRVVTSYLS